MPYLRPVELYTGVIAFTAFLDTSRTQQDSVLETNRQVCCLVNWRSMSMQWSRGSRERWERKFLRMHEIPKKNVRFTCRKVVNSNIRIFEIQQTHVVLRIHSRISLFPNLPLSFWTNLASCRKPWISSYVESNYSNDDFFLAWSSLLTTNYRKYPPKMCTHI